MINEFMRIDLDCVDTYITPRNPPGSTTYGTTVGPNQVCTLAGSTPGQQVVPGRDYIKAAFGYNTDDLWLNWGVTLIFFVGLQLLTMFVIEVFQHGKFSSALSIYKKEGPEEKKLNARLQERKQAFRSGEAEQDLSGITQSRKPFTWENLNYHVPVAGGQKRLLHDVFGYVKPGSLTALMGASGAGKTTLLDVLADRKSIGVITGDILIAGRPTDVAFQRGCGYCEQQDIHEPTATVREALRFSAYLRQPFETSKEEKDNYVEEIIQLLEMEDLADAMIGFPEFGLGVEARKRVTIGVELAAKPQLLLFLDEPTSGLDGQSAYNVVRFLKKLAAAGQAILCTIHQPNALLFEQFDRLLLLERGGETVYFGPIGQDSQQLINYFAANGAQCPSNVNPAEFMLEAIGAGSGRRIGPKAWSEIYRESDLFQQNLATIKELKEQSLADEKNNTAVNKEKEYSTPFWYQLRVVVARTCLAQWRMADYGFTRLFNHVSANADGPIGLFRHYLTILHRLIPSTARYRSFHWPDLPSSGQLEQWPAIPCLRHFHCHGYAGHHSRTDRANVSTE